MVVHRAPPTNGGNFWVRVICFAKKLFSRAAPHLSRSLTIAQPHSGTLASKAVESVIHSAVEKVHEKLESAQQGKDITDERRKIVKKHNVDALSF